MKKLQSIVKKLWPTAQMYKGFHRPSGRTGYIARPFGKNEIFLGETIKNAIEACEQKLYA